MIGPPMPISSTGQRTQLGMITQISRPSATESRLCGKRKSRRVWERGDSCAMKRYLTQLTDQIVAVVSDEQAMSFVWDSGTRNAEVPTMQAEDSDDDDDSRMFTFEVSKSEEQEEDVTGVPGFKVSRTREYLPFSRRI